MLLLSHPLRFLVVALAGWINEQQPEVIDYLQTENRVLREPQTPLTDLPPKDAILFDQIGERSPRSSQLATVRSRSRSTDRSITSGSLYHDHAKMAVIPSIVKWDTTGVIHVAAVTDPLRARPHPVCHQAHPVTD